MSNNPPDVILELTMDEAKFLLENCNSNIGFALNAIQNGDLSRPTVEALVVKMEQFKAVRTKLLTSGVPNA